MKRFHVNVSVSDLNQSTRFYSTLFGAAPTVLKEDYAKWILDDPRINFSISVSDKSRGINHVGLQADTMEELEAIQARLDRAGHATLDQPDAHCCYAQSSKTWVRDPNDVAWEAFVTHGEITHYGNDRAPAGLAAEKCCAGPTAERCCV